MGEEKQCEVRRDKEVISVKQKKRWRGRRVKEEKERGK